MDVFARHNFWVMAGHVHIRYCVLFHGNAQREHSIIQKSLLSRYSGNFFFYIYYNICVTDALSKNDLLLKKLMHSKNSTRKTIYSIFGNNELKTSLNGEQSVTIPV